MVTTFMRVFAAVANASWPRTSMHSIFASLDGVVRHRVAGGDRDLVVRARHPVRSTRCPGSTTSPLPTLVTVGLAQKSGIPAACR